MAQGDIQRAWDLHTQSMVYRVRGWFYDARAGVCFVSESATAEDCTNFTVHEVVNTSTQTIDWASSITRCRPAFGTLVLYGRQDFEPIEQAFQLQSQWPHVSVCPAHQSIRTPAMA